MLEETFVRHADDEDDWDEFFDGLADELTSVG